MPIPPLGRKDLYRLAGRLGLEIEPSEVPDLLSLAEMFGNQVGPIARSLDALGSNLIAGRRSEPRSDDSCNAVVTWCDVEGRLDGVLKGKKVGLKDNIAVAGVPMTCGSALLRDFVPQSDAVVVERLLEAGGRIVAKLNMDAFAWSGGGDTSSFGIVRNPVAPDRSASGSSGGSAAALYMSEIDVTLGTDQGGSIRVPASWCGVLGLKPTFGLVPYTGIVSMESTVDHVGPLARSVEEIAAVLTAIAGSDGNDPRQPCVDRGDYLGAVDRARDDLGHVTFGVLSEGFAAQEDPLAPAGTEETMNATRNALRALEELGATATTVSVPEHLQAPTFLSVMLMESIAASFESPNIGYGHRGRQDPAFDLALGRAFLGAGSALPPTVRIAAIVGSHLRAQYFGAVYSYTQMLCSELTTAIDRVLADIDFLVMPTTTHYPHHILENPSVGEIVIRGGDMFGNTTSSNISGHPAITLPMAQADGLPVGVMFVARRFEEEALLDLARTVERTIGWYPS